MSLLRFHKIKDVRLYRDAHRTECVSKVDLTKTYHVCKSKGQHISTNSWKVADAKYVEWSGDKKLELVMN